MYEHDPDQLSDSEFSPGSLRLLCAGNVGRMLDPRRTPIRVVGVKPEIGMFELEVTAFEDAGAHWLLPLEDFSSFQFAKGSASSDERAVAELEAAIRRFDEVLRIEVDHEARAGTERRLLEEGETASEWLAAHSEFVRSSGELDWEARTGPELLRSDLIVYLDTRGLEDIERSLTETWVSNPRSGELVKAHQIVMATLGLAPFDGLILRDEQSMSGRWSRRRREDHILARLGFVRSLFRHLNIEDVVLYRGLTFERQRLERKQATLISASFSRAVGEAMLDSDPLLYAASLHRQPVPVDRLFMTYLETEALNQKYKEAEAVIFSEPRGVLF